MESLKGPPPGFPGKTHTCRNCGLIGHLYKDCPHPIMSFGIICFRRGPSGIEYLMIQRKDSLSFMEFIRGKYDMHDIAYISQLLSHMTMGERNLLVQSSFNDLWNHVWYQAFLPRHTQEYYEARNKFEMLVKGFTTAVGNTATTFVNLDRLIRSTRSEFSEPEWGFPKGRRRLREDDLDCAVREFCEETGFRKEDLRICTDIKEFSEVFYGTNAILYSHLYFCAEMVGDSSKAIVVDPTNINQAREVRQISWFTADQVMKRIRDHNRERKALFSSAHNIILSTQVPSVRSMQASASQPDLSHSHLTMTNQANADSFAKKEGTSCGYLRPDAAPWIPGERFVFGFSNYVVPNHGITPRYQGTAYPSGHSI